MIFIRISSFSASMPPMSLKASLGFPKSAKPKSKAAPPRGYPSSLSTDSIKSPPELMPPFLGLLPDERSVARVFSSPSSDRLGSKFFGAFKKGACSSQITLAGDETTQKNECARAVGLFLCQLFCKHNGLGSFSF